VVSTSDSNGDADVLFPFEEIARDPDPDRRQQRFLECKRAVTSITENAQLKLKKLEHKVDYLTSVCPRTRPSTQCATPTTTRERERKASSSREITRLATSRHLARLFLYYYAKSTTTATTTRLLCRLEETAVWEGKRRISSRPLGTWST
jgi:hypothetical protein